jgi:hypothetical protein
MECATGAHVTLAIAYGGRQEEAIRQQADPHVSEDLPRPVRPGSAPGLGF